MMLERLRQLHQAATPGPWRYVRMPEAGDGFGVWFPDQVHGPSGYLCDLAENDPKADAELIVAAVNALPHLLDLWEANEELFDAPPKRVKLSAFSKIREALDRLDAEQVA